MKRFHHLFLIIKILFSSFTFVVEGGICASKPIAAKDFSSKEAGGSCGTAATSGDGVDMDKYLAIQKEAMRAVYNKLLPDKARKDAALARLENPPRTWFGVTDVSPEGFIREIKLSRKQLKGEIPQELRHLTKLQILYLADNKLRGQIPRELGELTKLQHLDLGGNKLRGQIPRELGELTELRTLFLNFNHLTGKIPQELRHLTKLQKLSLSYNQLTGKMPTELGELNQLQYLNLSDNQLTGPIPPELMDIIIH